MQRSFGTDHASFDDVGVPGFLAIQDSAEYTKTHHSQSDTFDKVWKDDLNQGAQVLAAWAYNTAQLPAMLPRRASISAKSRTDAGDAKRMKKLTPNQRILTTPDAASAKPDPISEMDTKILAQVKADEPELKANLQFLTDHIGPRLTGSAQSASKPLAGWLARFQQIGLANVHQEPWSIANGWTRGPATGRVFLSSDAKSGESRYVHEPDAWRPAAGRRPRMARYADRWSA